MTAVIFDFNGVIVDDEDQHLRAFSATLSEDGVTLDRDEYYATYLGLGDRELFDAVLRDKCNRTPSQSERDALVERKAAAYLRAIEGGVRLYPGVHQLIDELASTVPLAIASGARRHEIERILTDVDLRRYFQAIVSADDVAHSKPNPAPYLAAWRALSTSAADLEAAQCIVIEDAPAGIEAAHAAGMRCVAVATSRPRALLESADFVAGALTDLSLAKLLAVQAA